MSQTTFLVTGTARGIGFHLVSVLLKRPSTTVIATVRKITDESIEALTSLSVAATSSLSIMKLDSGVHGDAARVIEDLRERGIARLDVVIANAGVSTSLETVLQTSPEDLEKHFKINCVGPLTLFQACYPLMKGANHMGAKFCVISSSVGSIAGMEPLKCLAYGTSKAAVNFLVRKIHFECEDVIAFASHPGWVQTDMGASAAKSWGVERAPMTVGESVAGVLKQIDQATREGTSGKFVSYDGQEILW